MIPSDPNVLFRFVNYASVLDNFKLIVSFLQKLNKLGFNCFKILVSYHKFDFVVVHNYDLKAKLSTVVFHPWFVFVEILKQLSVGFIRKWNLVSWLPLVFYQVHDLLLSRVAILLGANENEVPLNGFILHPILKKADILKVASLLLIFYFHYYGPDTRAGKG